MDAVRTVDIGSTGGAKHNSVTPGRTPKAVRGRVIVIVGFRLYNSASDSINKQDRSYQRTGHIDGRGGKIYKWLGDCVHVRNFIQGFAKNQIRMCVLLCALSNGEGAAPAILNLNPVVNRLFNSHDPKRSFAKLASSLECRCRILSSSLDHRQYRRCAFFKGLRFVWQVYIPI